MGRSMRQPDGQTDTRPLCRQRQWRYNAFVSYSWMTGDNVFGSRCIWWYGHGRWATSCPFSDVWPCASWPGSIPGVHTSDPLHVRPRHLWLHVRQYFIVQLGISPTIDPYGILQQGRLNQWAVGHTVHVPRAHGFLAAPAGCGEIKFFN